MLQLSLYWPRPRDLSRPSPCICCLPPKTNIRKSRGGVSWYIRSLSSILFIKPWLHSRCFAPLHNPQFHFIKSLPDLLWAAMPDLLWSRIMAECHNFNYLNDSRLKGVGFNHFPVIKRLKCTFIRLTSCFHYLLNRSIFYERFWSRDWPCRVSFKNVDINIQKL